MNVLICVIVITFFLRISLALVGVSLNYQFLKASGVVVFAFEHQVWTFSNNYFSRGEDMQAANNVTTNHVTLSITEWYVQMLYVAWKCAN